MARFTKQRIAFPDVNETPVRYHTLSISLFWITIREAHHSSWNDIWLDGVPAISKRNEKSPQFEPLFSEQKPCKQVLQTLTRPTRMDEVRSDFYAITMAGRMRLMIVRRWKNTKWGISGEEKDGTKTKTQIIGRKRSWNKWDSFFSYSTQLAFRIKYQKYFLE